MKARPVKKSIKTLPERDAKRLTILLMGVLLLILVILALFPLLDRVNPKHEVATYSMDSYVQQTVYGKDRETAASDAASAVQLLENRISWRVEDSDIQKLNAHAGQDWIKLSAETMELLLLMQDVAEQSGGAFDVTIAPVSRLWDFDGARQEVPDADLLAEMTGNVGYPNLRLDPEQKTASLKYSSNAVDLGMVCKGAACDAAAEVYAAHRVSGAVIAVGSSVGLYGEKNSGQPWNIAVYDPASTEALGTLSLMSGFISTTDSGLNAFEENGIRYHAVLDPATGYPAESGLTSVTVVSTSGALSDALSAACFVLGPEDGLKLLETYGAEGLFVDTSGTVTLTDGLKSAFTLTGKTYTIAP